MDIHDTVSVYIEGNFDLWYTSWGGCNTI